MNRRGTVRSWRQAAELTEGVQRTARASQASRITIVRAKNNETHLRSARTDFHHGLLGRHKCVMSRRRVGNRPAPRRDGYESSIARCEPQAKVPAVPAEDVAALGSWRCERGSSGLPAILGEAAASPGGPSISRRSQPRTDGCAEALSSNSSQAVWVGRGLDPIS